MPNLIPSTSPLPERRSLLGGGLSRRTSRALDSIEHQAIVRAATVQAEGLVQSEKLHEIDHLTRQAMSGQALLRKWSHTLAQGDPFMSDDLRFFLDIAKVGKGEVIADTIDTFCRESRR